MIALNSSNDRLSMWYIINANIDWEEYGTIDVVAWSMCVFVFLHQKELPPFFKLQNPINANESGLNKSRVKITLV